MKGDTFGLAKGIVDIDARKIGIEALKMDLKFVALSTLWYFGKSR